MESLNKVFQTCIRTIHNKSVHTESNLNTFEWLKNDIIFDHCKSKESLHTRKNYLLAVGKLLKNNNFECKHYYEEALKTKILIDDNCKDQKLNKYRKNNYVDWETIIKKRQQLKRLFKKDYNNDNVNQQFLILCLYTMIPPLRNDYNNVEIVDKIIDKENNYIIKIDDAYHFYLNKDKMNYKKGQQIFIFPDKLNRVIDMSLDKFDRKYLLCNHFGNPLTKNNIAGILRRLYEDKNLSIVNLRSAKINHFYCLKKTTRQREKLANDMRHTYLTALRNYNKILKDDILKVKRLKPLKIKPRNPIPRNI